MYINISMKFKSEITFKRIFCSLFTGEVYFALFLTAGSFKTIIGLQKYIDLTLVFMILSMIVATKKLSNNAQIWIDIKKVGIPFFLLCFVAIISLLFTPSKVYAYSKLCKLLFLSGWSLLGSVILIRSKESVIKFFDSIIVVSVILAIEATIKYNEIGNSNFTNPFGTSYLDYSRLVSVSCIYILTYYVLRVKSKFRKYLSIMCFFSFFFFVANSGARGPLLILLICFLILPLLSINLHEGKICVYKWVKRMISIVILSLLLFAFLAKLGYFDLVINRFNRIQNEVINTNDEFSRGTLAKTAYNMWKEKPILGWGLGSFPMYAYGIDEENYPHNIALELMCELGIIGFLPILHLWIISIIKSAKALKRSNEKEMYYVYLTILIELWFGLSLIFFSNITDSRLMYAFISIAIVANKFKNDYVK